MSISPSSRRIAGATAAIAGLPVVAAGFLRLKYGPTVYQDLLTYRRSLAREKKLGEMREKNVQIIDFFEAHAKATPDKEFVLYRDEAYTYGDLDAEANQLAHFVQRSPAAASKETVAIFMLNEPSFVVSWLAFAKLGLRVALLNYNLRGDVLLHCIKVCYAKAIACGNDERLLEALRAIQPKLSALGITVWVLGRALQDHAVPDGSVRLDLNNLYERSDPIPRSARSSQPDDDALYVFTSGTTGLPKPAKIPHSRQVGISYFQEAAGMTKDDVIYVTLPLYHSNAFLLCLFNTVRLGGTVAIANFSASRFWDDVRKYRATVLQYVGEICRYLLAQPPRPDDGVYNHKIRYAIGNGLGSDIWEAFQKRFNVGQICELYGATDGVHIALNVDNKLGSCGRHHGILRALTDIIVIVQFDPETGQMLRGPDGYCLLTPAGEAGLLLMRINNQRRFDGYLADKKTNEKKLERNVKTDGDVFFNSGDLMVLDKDGYLYFKDRLGDTFRWKGENVATTEVENIVNQYRGIREANVYGVKVPGHDGRAGMASVVFKEGHQLHPKSFYDHVVRSLPLYACPKFLRVMTEMRITGTYKHKKTDLAREGFDLNVISDPLFFMDTEATSYVPLSSDTMRRIVVGQARL